MFRSMLALVFVGALVVATQAADLESLKKVLRRQAQLDTFQHLRRTGATVLPKLREVASQGMALAGDVRTLSGVSSLQNSNCNSHVTAACAAASEQVTSQQCSTFLDNLDKIMSSEASDAMIASFLNSCDTCVGKIKDFTESCRAFIRCEVSQSREVEVFTPLIVPLVEVLCVREGNGMCVGNAIQSFTTVVENDSNPTTEELDAICKECLTTFVNVLSSIERMQARRREQLGLRPAPPSHVQTVFMLLEVACMKHDNEYCLPVFIRFTEDQEKAGGQMDMTKLEEYICRNMCIRKVFRAMINMGAALSPDGGVSQALMFEFMSEIVCLSNANGEKCHVVMAKLDGNNQAEQEVTAFVQSCLLNDVRARATNQLAFLQATSNVTCPNDRCRTAIQFFHDQGGCCGGSLLRFIVVQAGVAMGIKPSEIPELEVELNKYLRTCVSGMESRCSVRQGTRHVRGRIATNIEFSFYRANKARLDAAAQKDIAESVGMEPDNVINVEGEEVTTGSRRLRARNSKTAFKYELQGNDDAQTAEAGEDLKAQVSSGSLTLSNTEAAVAENGGDPASAKVDPANSSVETDDDGSAGHVSVSLSLAIAVATMLAVM